MHADFALAPTDRFERIPARPRSLHRLFARAIATSSLVAAIGYMLPAHRVGRGSAHSNLADGGPFSLALLGVVVIAALLLRGRRFGSGMLTGAIAMLGAALALVPVLATHLIEDVDHAYGQYIFVAALGATFVAGAALAISEPLRHGKT